MQVLHTLSHKVYYSNFKAISYTSNFQNSIFQSKKPNESQANPIFNQNQTRTTHQLKCSLENTLEFSIDETQVMLSDEQLQKIKTQFELADLDGNGVIDMDELRKLLESTEGGMAYSVDSWLPEQQLQKIMNKYDTEKKGSLTFEQFAEFTQANILLQGTLKEYKRIFKACDINKNGKIGFNELSALFERLGMPMSDEKLSNIMMEYDIDSSGFIDFEEFLLFFQNQLLELQSVLKYIQDIDYMKEPNETRLVQYKPGQVITIFNESEFDEIIEENKNTLTVIFAGLTWCRPCKSMIKPYQTMANSHPKLRFVKFFGNANSSTKNLFTMTLKAKATPSFFFFRDGKMVHSHTGRNKSKLDDYIKAYASEEELNSN